MRALSPLLTIKGATARALRRVTHGPITQLPLFGDSEGAFKSPQLLKPARPSQLHRRSSSFPTHDNTLPSIDIHHILISISSTTSKQHPNHSKWHPRLKRPPPPPARHQLEKRLRRRRRLARRPPPPLVTRRSAPRPARRPTARTSTRFSSRSTLILVSPTAPCPS